MTTAPAPIRRASRLGADEVRDVLHLADAVRDADGVYPLAEHVVLAIQAGSPAVHLQVRTPDGALAGYAHLTGADAEPTAAGPAEPTAELAVHPAHRRRGVGTALLAAAVDAAGAQPLYLWAHGDRPAARALAERAGFLRVRVLWQMRRSLAEPLPDIPMPDGVSLRAFRPGTDDEAWLSVNAAAFADHPEQGRWTAADLRARFAEPWFDPAGFLLAVDAGGRLLGYHWTKVHAAEGIGEVYVLGVDPGGHRRGLGAALTVAGLRHLRDHGLPTAMLYVDDSNLPAVALYRRLGFEVWSTDVGYRRAPR